MALLDVLAAILTMLGIAARGLFRGLAAASKGLSKGVRGARTKGGAGEPGMIRLLDLHAASIAGDTLIAIGLAGTIFFSVPAGEARGRVALYLLVTMLPFALLAPVVGPLLDRFRHGRRYALATTFLGRAFLAYLISEHIDEIALYPAAFGILVLSRAYGVARSAAVPRLLPSGLALSEANARASLFGTVAAGVAAPIGIALAASFGQAWPLRIATVIFLYGMVTALRLPPRADSEPPEVVPRALQSKRHKGPKILSKPLVVATILGTATLRAVYGFLALYLAFSIRAGDLETEFLGTRVRETAAIGLIAGALVAGSFLATAIGTGLHIKRPTLLQAVGIALATVAGVLAAWWYTLPWVALLCLVAALAAGLAKLAVDAVIQECTDEKTRATAFAHAETLLMIAWVAGGALGLVPFGGRWGLVVLAAALALGAARAVWSAVRLRGERLHGVPGAPSAEPTTDVLTPLAPAQRVERPAPVPEPARTQRTRAQPTRTKVLPAAPVEDDDDDDTESPGFHLYRPSGRDS
jgi:MFS family permease